MVCFYCIDHCCVFFVTFQETNTDRNVGAFHFMVNALTDIVEQAGTFCQCYIHAQFCGHQTCQMGNFHGVFQYILTIACAVFQFTQQLDQFGMQTIDTCVKGCCFAFFSDRCFHFFSCLFHHFLDTRRMNTAVYDQFFQSQSCDLSSDGIEAGQDDCFRCIVDDQIDTCQCFQCTDVSAFAADDTAFHFIVRQLYNGYGCFCHMVYGAALDRIRNDLSGAFVRFHLCLAFRFFDEQSCFVFYIVFYHSENVVLRFFGSQTGDTFQFL